jgi:hypothetical protein
MIWTFCSNPLENFPNEAAFAKRIRWPDVALITAMIQVPRRSGFGSLAASQFANLSDFIMQECLHTLGRRA